MTDGAASTALDSAPGCTNVWQHLGTRASLGPCGRKPAPHKFTVTCNFCNRTGNQSACEVCWPSIQVLGLCGTCFNRTELKMRGE